MTKNCPECGAPIGKGAYKCRCGWKGSASPSFVSAIACAYLPCEKPALCRVFTKTGWANVCTDHYGTAQFTRPVANSPVVEEVLKAYHKSKAYAQKMGRDPGEDDEELAA